MSQRTHRPIERFWPVRGEARRAHGAGAGGARSRPPRHAVRPRDLPFSITLVFPPFDGPDYERAVAKARASAEYLELGEGDTRRHRARFFRATRGGSRTCSRSSAPPGGQVLIDDRPIPYSRELWLPLIWFLLLDLGSLRHPRPRDFDAR